MKKDIAHQIKEIFLMIKKKEFREHRDENGELHREDGPAMECFNGAKVWYIHGKRHRENGAAVEWADGVKSWYWKNEWIMETEGPVTEAQIKEFRLRRMV